jgi:hypothetical protein
MTFELDPKAVGDATDLYWSELRPINFSDGYSAWFMERSESRTLLREESMPPLVRAYVDAQTDLHRLLEEIRFEAAFACLLLRDYREKRERGEAPRLEPSPLPFGVLDAEVSAVLSRYMRDPPSPADFLRSPHEEIAGRRISSAGSRGNSLIARSSAKSPHPIGLQPCCGHGPGYRCA